MRAVLLLALLAGCFDSPIDLADSPHDIMRCDPEDRMEELCERRCVELVLVTDGKCETGGPLACTRTFEDADGVRGCCEVDDLDIVRYLECE